MGKTQAEPCEEHSSGLTEGREAWGSTCARRGPPHKGRLVLRVEGLERLGLRGLSFMYLFERQD